MTSLKSSSKLLSQKNHGRPDGAKAINNRLPVHSILWDLLQLCPAVTSLPCVRLGTVWLLALSYLERATRWTQVWSNPRPLKSREIRARGYPEGRVPEGASYVANKTGNVHPGQGWILRGHVEVWSRFDARHASNGSIPNNIWTTLLDVSWKHQFMALQQWVPSMGCWGPLCLLYK